MKCVITIGYTQILLPDDKNIGKIIETLSKGVECSYHPWDKTCEIRDEIEVSVKILPPSTKISVQEEMMEKMEEVFASTRKPGTRSTPRVAGKSQLLLVEKKGQR
jgi:hypothetical protein